MPDHLARRIAIVAIAAATLVGGGVAIRLASTWTATAATLTDRPASAEELVAELEGERAFAQGLRSRLTAMSEQVNALRVALDEARAHASGEADAAAALASELDAAEAKLAELQRALAAAPPTITVVTEAPAAAAPLSGDEDSHEADEEDEHEVEDD